MRAEEEEGIRLVKELVVEFRKQIKKARRQRERDSTIPALPEEFVEWERRKRGRRQTMTLAELADDFEEWQKEKRSKG